jgi:tetratricopeptide (TPR) repeat protein
MKQIILAGSLALASFVADAAFSLVVPSHGLYAQNTADSYKKGKDLYNQKKYAEALPNLDAVIKTDENNLMALFYRGVSHYHLKNYEQAIADLDRAIEMYPVRADFYYFRAMARKEMKDISMAYSDLSNAIALDGKVADYYYQRAELGLQIGEANTATAKAETEQTDATNALAIIDLDKALALNPKLQTAVSQKRKATFGKLTANELEMLPLTASGKGGTVPPDDQKTIEVKKYISDTQFKSLEEGRSYYNQLYLQTLPTGKKAGVLAMLRSKILKDVYGNEPYIEDLDQMKLTLDREYWLLPEGRDYYFKAMQNSKYVFSGGVQRGKVYYYYKVAKGKNTDKYRLQMYGVYNGESNLVFDSQVAYSEDSLKRNVQVFASQSLGYKWNVLPESYMKGEVIIANNMATFAPVGTLVELAKDAQHGLAKDKYAKAIKPTDKTSTAAIKATLQYVILDYIKLVKIPSWWGI